jgi:hypothetical protein
MLLYKQIFFSHFLICILYLNIYNHRVVTVDSPKDFHSCLEQVIKFNVGKQMEDSACCEIITNNMALTFAVWKRILHLDPNLADSQILVINSETRGHKG